MIEKKDYSNIYTNVSLKVSEKVRSIIDNGIKFIFKRINNMVSE